MLPQSPKDANKRTNEEKISVQRRIITVLSLLLAVMSISICLKVGIDVWKGKQAEDIIESARNEANQILSDAQDEATMIKHNAIKEATDEATIIIEEAKITASATIEEANNKAITILQNAESEADEIISKAVNTKIDEIEILLAVTEAEASNQSVKGRAAVASTITNRVKSKKFKASSIKAVVYTPGQFDTVSSGKIYRVTPSKETIEGVKIALQGKDYSNGALYFYNPSRSGKRSRNWFNTLETTAVIEDHVFKK